MARTSYKPDQHNWRVAFPLGWTIQRAVDEDEAKQKVLQKHGLASKSYLARDWEVRIATAEEIKVFAVWADNRRPSQTPERQSIEARRGHRKTTQERLI